MISCLLLLLSTTCTTAKINMYPHTLIDTDIPCSTMSECTSHYNNSWCVSAGVLCIHRRCRLIPDFPCRATTQVCQEDEKRCVDKKCLLNSDCDNGIYCDGIEVCSTGTGLCVTDPRQPNCLYTGGRCDEKRQTCYESSVRLAWRNSREYDQLRLTTEQNEQEQAAAEDDLLGHEYTDKKLSLLMTIMNTPGNDTPITVPLTVVNTVSVIIVFSVTGLLFIVILILVISRSIRGDSKPNRRYTIV